MDQKRFHTIVLYPTLQVDTIGAIFLLREFGEAKLPGVNEAKLEFWNSIPEGKTAEQLEGEGYVLIDIGRGKFDHHRSQHGRRTDTAATLVADFLGVRQRPELKKFFLFVQRDDLEGKGIVSRDVIDRSFGLPAIIKNLSRDYPQHPEFVVELVYRIFLASYHEEYRRKVLVPQEWANLQRQGKGSIVDIPARMRTVRLALVESDSEALAGFLRSVRRIGVDIVVQRLSSGHTNIISRNRDEERRGGRMDFRSLARTLRQLEAAKKGKDVSHLSPEELERPGTVDGLEEWFYDIAANTLQNGGLHPQGTSPTKLSLQEVRSVLERVLPELA